MTPRHTREAPSTRPVIGHAQSVPGIIVASIARSAKIEKGIRSHAFIEVDTTQGTLPCSPAFWFSLSERNAHKRALDRGLVPQDPDLHLFTDLLDGVNLDGETGEGSDSDASPFDEQLVDGADGNSANGIVKGTGLSEISIDEQNGNSANGIVKAPAKGTATDGAKGDGAKGDGTQDAPDSSSRDDLK